MQQPPSMLPGQVSGGVRSGVRSQSRSVFEDSDWDQDADPPVEPLTREQAQAVIARHPSWSVWQILSVQAAFGVLVALIWGGVSQSAAAFWSSLYAAAVVVLPGVLMARGIFGGNAARGVVGLLFWQLVRLGFSGALLVLAPRLIRPIDWAALLVTLVLCMKVIGVVLYFVQGRKKNFV